MNPFKGHVASKVLALSGRVPDVPFLLRRRSSRAEALAYLKGGRSTV